MQNKAQAARKLQLSLKDLSDNIPRYKLLSIKHYNAYN